ncbi:MAG: hypothetical protein KatS3mg095_0397 [Candidatus Parcubacteria bacterium]|nr:MAG: hypothetical protein KatS3mg095_0397 [Candidatus Parcubacteria bacterium]
MEEVKNKKFVCQSCGSESEGTAGYCCGAERVEKKEEVCLACVCPCEKHKEHNHQ